ncbi:MAG TPA: hypothetical protein VFT29_13615 [Gemmatimonadaceae bacterium]|nr:hypothetical protein [Gemmatimonadaceae bacterium]
MRTLFVIAVLASVLATPDSALAQGKGPGNGKVPPGQAKKVTPSGAVVVIRDVFVHNGYDVVRVEQVGLTQVVYYRRGNMGKGKGKGPLERMVVRPSNNIVVFDGGPATLLVNVRLRLGI